MWEIIAFLFYLLFTAIWFVPTTILAIIILPLAFNKQDVTFFVISIIYLILYEQFIISRIPHLEYNWEAFCNKSKDLRKK